MTHLRNGTLAPDAVVSTVFEALQTMQDRHPRAYRDLVTLARDPSYEMPEPSANLTWAFRLLGFDGNLEQATRTVILASVEGDEMRLVDPRAAALGVLAPEVMP